MIVIIVIRMTNNELVHVSIVRQDVPAALGDRLEGLGWPRDRAPTIYILRGPQSTVGVAICSEQVAIIYS